MRSSILLALAFVLLLTLPAIAAPEPPDIDSTPDRAVLVNIDEWSGTHLLQPGQTQVIERLSTSPRYAVSLRNSSGLNLANHFHPHADEILIVYKGSGELLVNGAWIRVKPGDVHVNPRGAIHATRCAPGEEMTVVSIFTPPRNESVTVE